MIGPPLAICFLNKGTTEPEDRTLPNLPLKRMYFLRMHFYKNLLIHDQTFALLFQLIFDAPIMFAGLTALSVEINKIFQHYNF